MEHLLELKQLNFSRWRRLSESTIFSHSSRRTYADDCWTMIKDAKTFTLSDPGEPGATFFRGAHKDNRNWKFVCRREPQWRQRRGVPIGGMVSNILCSVVMGASETRWKKIRCVENLLASVEKQCCRPPVRG